MYIAEIITEFPLTERIPNIQEIMKERYGGKILFFSEGWSFYMLAFYDDPGRSPANKIHSICKMYKDLYKGKRGVIQALFKTRAVYQSDDPRDIKYIEECFKEDPEIFPDLKQTNFKLIRKPYKKTKLVTFHN